MGKNVQENIEIPLEASLLLTLNHPISSAITIKRGFKIIMNILLDKNKKQRTMCEKGKLLLLISCLMFLVYGCAPAYRTLSKEMLKLSELNLVLDDSLVFKDRKVVALETNEASMIKNIDRLCLDGDTLAVFDRSQKKIILFGGDGRYISSIHDVGSGPAEYMQISDICLDVQNKQIVLLCNQPYKFMFYTYSGKFIKEANFSSYYSNFVMNDNMIYCNAEKDNGESVLHVYDSSAKFVNEVRIPSTESFKSESSTETISFNIGNSITSGKNAFFTREFDNSIYVFSEGEVHSKYTIDFQKHQMPAGLNSKYDVPFDFIDECRKKKYIHSIADVMESDHKLLFKTNLGICLNDKESKDLKGFRFINNKALGGGTSAVMSMNDGEHLAVKYDREIFRKRVDDSKKKNIPLNDNLLKVYNSIDDESNPVLLIYQF